MVTCWLALTSCGDTAPGLELAGPGHKELLPLEALSERGIAAAHGSCDGDCPVLGRGDALVFAGGVLHRTHVTQAMTQARTSIELRFVAPSRIANRLPGRRLLTLH